jgi:hypothetical protein
VGLLGMWERGAVIPAGLVQNPEALQLDKCQLIVWGSQRLFNDLAWIVSDKCYPREQSHSQKQSFFPGGVGGQTTSFPLSSLLM